MMFAVRFCLILAACVIAQAESFSGRIVAVTDGDTISVMREGREARVRLHGIDCPESGQPFGARAKRFVSELAFGNVVTVEVLDVDRYGRLIGDVVLPNGRSLNRELVKIGFAWWYRKYAPRDTVLQGLEMHAKSLKLGLWSHANAVPPWEWRKGVRELAGVRE